DRSKSVQEIKNRNLHLVKPDPTVIDTIETGFIAIVFHPDTGKQMIVFIPEGDDHRMYPLIDPPNDQLAKDRSQSGRTCSTNINFTISGLRTMDDQHMSIRNISRRGLYPAHIGPMALLGH